MDAAAELADEVGRLRRCLDDVGSLMALPALSAGREPLQIVTALTDALLGVLGVAFVLVRFNDPEGGQAIEVARADGSFEGTAGPHGLADAIDEALAARTPGQSHEGRLSIGAVDVSVASSGLGPDNALGVVIVGSRDLAFPSQTARLLLDVAANRVTIALQHALLLSDREKERESRLTVDSIPGLVAILTPSGDPVAVNDRVVEYCGRSIEELQHWATNDTLHPEDRSRVVQRFADLISSGLPSEWEARVRRFDGVYRWFQFRALPLRHSSGHIVRWYALLTDIDDLKRADGLLAGEKRLLEMVASGCALPAVLDVLCKLVEETATNCHCAVYLIDRKDRVFHGFAAPTLPASFNGPLVGSPVNPATGPCGMAACHKTQVIAADIVTDPLWLASPFRPLALAHGLRSCWSTPILSLMGEVLGTFAIYQRVPSTPTLLQQDLIGQVTHLASIAIERTQWETALKRSEAFLAEGQRLAQLGNFAWRVSTGEISWSEQIYRMFEFDPGTRVTLEMIGSRVHPEDLPLLHDMAARAQRGDSHFEYQHRLVMPDQSIKHLHLVAHGAPDEQGRMEYIGAVQDVTRRRLAEEALDRARSELAHVSRVTTLSALTASIAHEVNQPLSGIITNAGTCLRMLDAVPPDVHGARETARRTIRDGHRASDVIARLRALFSRREFTLEALDLNEATREVIALSSNDLQRHRVILHPELADGLPLVGGDRIQIQQVILNLLRNAADAMVDVHDRPRQLLIRTEQEAGDRVRLTVRDAGVGLPPQDSHDLFDAFYTTKTGGMGIGLFVSRSIIEKHQGRLWAERNDGSPGATFSFSIPRELKR